MERTEHLDYFCTVSIFQLFNFYARISSEGRGGSPIGYPTFTYVGEQCTISNPRLHRLVW